MVKSLNIWVDDKPAKLPLGYTVMQGCALVGADIPRFCYHDKLLIAGNCRICLVEITGSKKLVASCAVHVFENINVYTNTVRVRLARQNVLEFLLANHPLDCPICDQGGECDLQDITVAFGADRGRFYEQEKRAVLNKDFGPLIRTSMNRCIHCTRCVRFLSQVSGVSSLGTLGRGAATEIGTYIGKFLYDELSGNITDLCPVGALTSKPYSFKVRPWELTSVRTLDVLDAVNSSIMVDISANKISRILPYANESLNEEWITNKARYSYDGIFSQRIYSCLIKTTFNLLLSTKMYFYVGSVFFAKLSWEAAFGVFLRKLFARNTVSFQSYIGGLVDFETTLSAKQFINFLGSSSMNLSSNSNVNYNADFTFLFLFNSSLLSLSKKPSFCLLVGANPRFESPVLNLKLTRLSSDFNVPFYSIGLGLNYLTFQVNSLTTNLNSFFKVCEFTHPFCKNIYLNSFLAQPLIVMGSTILNRVDSNLFTHAVILLSRKLLYLLNGFSLFYLVSTAVNDFFFFFHFFGFLHIYSSKIHALEIGFLPGVAEFKGDLGLGCVNAFAPPSRLIYSIGCDDSFLGSVFLSLKKRLAWRIYQGSHGVGVASFAELVFPVSTFLERTATYINLVGLKQKTTLTLSAVNFNKTDMDIFSEITSYGLGVFQSLFFGFRFYSGVNYFLMLNLRHKAFSQLSLFYKNIRPINQFLLLKNNLQLLVNYRYLLFYEKNSSSTDKMGFNYFDLQRTVKLNTFNAFKTLAPSNSALPNYYGDTANNVVFSSKVMNLCSNLFLKKNFSFSFCYY